MEIPFQFMPIGTLFNLLARRKQLGDYAVFGQ